MSRPPKSANDIITATLPSCVIYRGAVAVADASTPGQALRWIQEKEAARLKGDMAS